MEVTIMDFPVVIMVEILSRLPILSIFRCKCVCKSWYNIFSDPLFPKLYHPSFPCILRSAFGSIYSILELKADYDYSSLPQNRPIKLSHKFHLPIQRLEPIRYIDYRHGNVNPEFSIIGSVNGFICLLNGDAYGHEFSICISNPLLGEYFKINLPKGYSGYSSYAFCFSNVATGQYKILRSVVRKSQGRYPKVSELEVYTLGVDLKWRNLGEAPYGSFSDANVNGAIHWLNDKDDERCTSIYCFNIETEKVKSLPAPPRLETPSSSLMLVELGDCLCLFDHSHRRPYVDLWWMKEYGIAESWTRDCILMDSIYVYRPVPFLIWKDGEILMDGEGSNLLSYYPKVKQFREVNVYGRGIGATRYTPSFYSLKTIMGDHFQVSNVYPKVEIV